MVDLYLQHPEVQPADLRLRTRAAAVTGTSYPRTALDAVAVAFGAVQRQVAVARRVADVIDMTEGVQRQVTVARRVADDVALDAVATRQVGHRRVASQTVTPMVDVARRVLTLFRFGSEALELPGMTLELIRRVLGNRRPLRLTVQAGEGTALQVGTGEHLG